MIITCWVYMGRSVLLPQVTPHELPSLMRYLWAIVRGSTLDYAKQVQRDPHLSYSGRLHILCPPESDTALHVLHRFQSITDYLNIPIKQSKTVFPTTCAILYEIEVDTTTIVLKLPQDRLITALDKVNDMCKRKRVQLRNLQSLLGLLSFCCKPSCLDGHF